MDGHPSPWCYALSKTAEGPAASRHPLDPEETDARAGAQKVDHAMDTTFSRRRKTRIAALAAAGLALVSLGTGASSLALFTSSGTVAANTFTTGTVVISTSPATALVTFASMAPGDAVTAPITVTNSGTLALRYAVSSVATNVDTKGLKDQLVLTVKSGVTTCTNAAYAADGTSLYTGDLDSSAGLLVGDATPGANAGDRTLAAAANDVLCFHVSLPLATGNLFQAASTTATFTFAAEQTVNN
jgi:spore coat-associated protein N